MTSGTPIVSLCDEPLYIKGIDINGTPLHQYGRIERVWGNVLGSPTTSGQPFHVPLRIGMIDVRPVPTYSDFTVGITLHGTTSADGPGLHSAWRELARLLWDMSTPLTVTRHVEFQTGVESHVCAARYVSGLDAQLASDDVQGLVRTTVRFRNLDAYWYSAEEVSRTVTGAQESITLAGDVETSRMNIVLSGGTPGTPQVLTNETTGVSVTFGGDTSSFDALLRVQDFTAVQNSQSVLAYIAHSGAVQWMTMAPGENIMTLTGGGQAQITMRSAYL